MEILFSYLLKSKNLYKVNITNSREVAWIVIQFNRIDYLHIIVDALQGVLWNFN